MSEWPFLFNRLATAKVRMPTDLQPALNSSPAQASNVAPVVNTSSTSNIFLFAMAEGSVTAKTVRTFSQRSSLFLWV